MAFDLNRVHVTRFSLNCDTKLREVNRACQFEFLQLPPKKLTRKKDAQSRPVVLSLPTKQAISGDTLVTFPSVRNKNDMFICNCS